MLSLCKSSPNVIFELALELSQIGRRNADNIDIQYLSSLKMNDSESATARRCFPMPLARRKRHYNKTDKHIRSVSILS